MRLKTTPGAAVAAVAVLAALATPLAFSQSAAATVRAECGRTPADIDGGGWYATASGATNMRTGASISCGIRGVTYSGQALDYHCFDFPLADDDWSWTYARNVSTGVEGWIRNDLLTDRGSRLRCAG
ncbi:SH3 domain-containing protein [Streptomyces sp. NBC_01142]|uniref:SH3 domain-containing protein n=1 Tax=Streptomyces sp. NBC_01142 TaxID=2975865 RepID=UPI0022569AA5|nr:SH3 domain-containing protein [Streptomyces sp. NBC_01142]MCX4821606.1 SH3 domain-containing protein [Streptomyces sp. NBC_01142]